MSRDIYLPEKWIQKERGGNEFSERTDLYFYFINDSAQLTMVERIGIQFRFTISMRLAENEIEEEEKRREAESVWEFLEGGILFYLSTAAFYRDLVAVSQRPFQLLFL